MIKQSTNSRVLVIIITALLLANIGTLCFFLLNKPPHKRGGGFDGMQKNMAYYLKDSLRFNEGQMTQFDTLSSIHHRSIRQLFDNMQSGKEQQFKELAQQSFSDSAIATAVDQSCGNQRALEKEMLLYLKHVRDLCTDDQRSRFDTGFYKLLMRRRDREK